MAVPAPTFYSTFLQFCDDLKGTFPELSVSAATALSEDEALRRFRSLWKSRLAAVAARDTGIFGGSGVEVVPGLVITGRLWNEVSKNTHNAIWSYLNSLILLSAVGRDDEEGDDDTFWDDADFKRAMEEMIKNSKVNSKYSKKTASNSILRHPFSTSNNLLF